MKNVKPISMAAIRERYNPGEGRHFFDRDTLRFFRGKLPRSGYEGPGGTYFVTSEQFVGSDRIASPRKYTVRQLQGEGKVKTIGEFNKLDRAEATEVAKLMAGMEVIQVHSRGCSGDCETMPDGSLACATPIEAV